MNPVAPSQRGEFALIRWIRERSAGGPGVVRGIGDDCAVLRPRPGVELLITTDMLMDGRHFRLEEAGAEAVGYKAMAVNVSDIAAMAGVPLAAVVSVALPRASAGEVAQDLHAGLARCAERFGVSLIGGDTNAWDGPLVINVALLGESTERGPVYRSGAKPGDVVFVTGPLGGSLLGRHLHPDPRVPEALALHQRVPLHAMIDLSDGLSSDLAHILEESGGLGAILDSDAIPVHPDAAWMSAQDSRSPLEHALDDGEDFELSLCVSPNDARTLENSPPPGVTLHRIGLIDNVPGLRLRTQDGRVTPWASRGFDHLRPNA